MASSDRLRVRLGEPADEDAVFEAMRQMHSLAESGFRHQDGKPFAFSESKVRNSVRAALVHYESWIGIAEVNERAAGVVMLALSTPFYSESPYLAEQTLFVLPEYRGTSCARRLLEFSKALSAALNLPLAIAVMSADRTETKTKLYERALGQKASGSVFLCHLKSVS
jgi:GNAT superfamily N-acetyltransferase